MPASSIPQKPQPVSYNYHKPVFGMPAGSYAVEILEGFFGVKMKMCATHEVVLMQSRNELAKRKKLRWWCTLHPHFD